MPVVDVLGVGEVEFPDEFTPEQIRDVLREKFAAPSVAPEAPLQAENPNPLEPILMDGREEIAGLQTGTTPEAQQSDRIFAARLAELGPDISRFTAQVGAAGELSIPPTVRENDVFLVPDPQDNSLTFWRRSKDGAMPVEREEFIQRVRENSYFTPRKTEFEGPEDTGLTRGESARGAFAQGAMSNLGGALEGAGIIDRMILPSGAREIAEGRMALGSEIQEAALERFPTNPIFEGTILQKMAQGAGSSLPFAVTGTLGGFLGPATSAFLGSLQSGAEQYKRAKAMGVSEEKAKTAFGVGALGGATEAFGIGRTGARVAEGIGSEVAEEMGQEGIQGFFGLLAQANYDPKTVEDRMKIRQVAEAAENMLIGGLTAGVIKLPSALTQKIFDSAEKPEPAPPESAKGKAQRSLTSPVEIPTVPPEGLRTEAEQEGTAPTTPVPPSAPTETPAPIVEETEGTNEQQPLQLPRKIIAPVLSIPGGPERVGKLGQSHKDVRKEATDEDLDLTEAQHMFRLDDGTNVTRADAWQIAKAQGLIKPDVLRYRESRATAEKPAELQTEDLLPLTFTEPATQQGPLSDVLESVNVYLHGPTDITNELRPDVTSVNVTDRVTGNTFQLPQDVTPEEIVTELNKRKRTFKVPEVTLPESFRGITQPLPFSPKEETTDASQISQTAEVGVGVPQPEVTPQDEGQVPIEEGGAQVPPSVTTAPEPSGEVPNQIGIRNAMVDKQREARGLSPRMSQAKRSFGTLWERAMQTVAADPAAGSKLVEAMEEKPRPLDDWENALLLHEMVVRENDYDLAVDEVNTAKDEAALARAQEKLAAAAKRNQQIYDVDATVGTEQGRALNARKLLAERDFSLARMNAETRAVVNDGKPLTKQQSDENRRLHAELQAAQKKLAALEAREKAFTEAQVFRQLLNEQKKQAKQSARKGATITEFLDDAAEKARQRIISRRGRLTVTIDPLNIAGLVDEAIIGSSYIARGIRDFAQWSAQMLKDFGNRIEPYLPALFQQSQQYHDANAKLFSQEDLVGKAKADAAAGRNVDPKLIFDLARQKVNQGVTELHNVMEAVTTDLQGAYPDITEREVRDAFSGYGKVRYPSKAEDLKKLRELRRLGQLASAIEDVAKKQAPKRSGMQRDEPSQIVREKMRELREAMKENEIDVTSPDQQLKSVNAARATQLRNQIEDLDKQLRTGQKPKKGAKLPDSPEVERLRSERDAMRELLQEIEEAQNPKLSPEERQLAKDKRAIKRRMEILEDKIRRGDYTKPVRRDPLMDKEKRELQFKIQEVKETFSRGVFDAMMAKRSLPRRVFDTGREALNTMRAVMTSIDFSAVARQGGFIAFGHPVRAAKSLGPMFRAFASKQAAFNINREILERDNADLYRQGGLYLADQNTHLLSKMEEAFMSRWAEKIPLIAGSQRAYVTFLNKLRSDSFDAMAATLTRTGKPTLEETKAIANFINVATGRGSQGLGRYIGPSLNTIFFSPRYAASRFQLMAGQPFYNGTARTRKMVAKEYARFLMGAAVVYALARAGQDDDDPPIETDPRSSDFGKVRFGNSRLDPLGGLLQNTVLLSRVASGETKKGGKVVPIRGEGIPYRGDDTYDVLSRFARTKFSPAFGSAVNLATGKDVVGQPVSLKDEAIGMVVPLSLQDILPIMQDNGIPKGTALQILNTFGLGVQHYGKERAK